MQDVVREWVERAEGDFVTALREWRARKKRNPDAICFHAQQCVEKYLKALLQKDRTPFPKTHDLVILSKASLSKHPFLGPELSNMDTLSRFAVLFRYPGESAKTADAMAAVRLMKTYRAALRQALDLSEHEPN